MALEAVLAAATTVASAISGVASSFCYAPESLNVLPCHVTMPKQGSSEQLPSGWEWTIHDVSLRLYVARADLPTGIAQATPFLERYLTAYNAHLSLAGTVQECNISDYNVGIAEYAGLLYVVLDMTLTAIEKRTFTRAA